MKKLMMALMMVAVLAAGHVHAGAGEQAVAVEAAESWLKLIDAKEYSKSWHETASYFQEMVSERDWNRLIRTTETTVGQVTGRTFISATYLTEIPNAPEGEFFLIQYSAELADGGKAIETVTPMKDADNVWRVSGYYINPL